MASDGARQASEAHALTRLLQQAAGAHRTAVTLVACTPRATEVLAALTAVFPATSLRVVTSSLQAAEAARASVPVGRQPAVSIHLGETPADAGTERADVVLLWPSGWEGDTRVRAQVAAASTVLPPGGRLYVLAAKSKGAATYLRLLKGIMGNAATAARGSSGIRLLAATKEASTIAAAADPALHAVGDEGERSVEAEVLGRRFMFRTAPGLFSPERLDSGTRLLLEVLHHEPLGRVTSILDLGCGYGAIGVVLAAQHPQATVTLSDVDSRVVALARRSVQLNGVERNAQVRLSDGLRHLRGQRFDLIVSHFPLHIPKAEQLRLLTEARDGLVEDGRIYLVSLSAYDLRPLLRAVFGGAATVAEGPAGTVGLAKTTGAGGQYRVVAATRAGASAV